MHSMLALTICPLRLPQGRQSHRSVVRLSHESRAPLRDVAQRAAVLSLPRRALCAAAGLALAAGPASQATASQAVGSVVQHGQSSHRAAPSAHGAETGTEQRPQPMAPWCLLDACREPGRSHRLTAASATQVVIGAVQARPGKGPEDMLVWKTTRTRTRAQTQSQTRTRTRTRSGSRRAAAIFPRAAPQVLYVCTLLSYCAYALTRYVATLRTLTRTLSLSLSLSLSPSLIRDTRSLRA